MNFQKGSVKGILRSKAKVVLLLLLGFILSGFSNLYSQKTEDYSALAEISRGKELQDDSTKREPSAVNDYIRVYQKYIGGIRGQECPMYPSCSNYGLKTFNETNFFAAFALTSDRLLRCGHDHYNYPLTLNAKGFKYLDYPAYDTPPSELIYRGNVYSFAHADTIKADSTLLFIQRLVNNQYHREALLEIMRVQFLKNEFNIHLFINKIICLKALDQYEQAIFEFEMKCPQEYKENAELLLQMAVIYHKLNNHQKTIAIAQAAQENATILNSKAMASILKGVSYANLNQWESAIQEYEYLNTFESYQRAAEANKALALEGLNFKGKNPTVAGLLSVIPGLGYAYAGHKQTAISALLVNGLITYATYSNLKNENYGMAALTGVFNISFYIGNIAGSIQSTKRYNKQQKQYIIDKLTNNSNL